MSQHFLLSAKARTLSVRRVFEMNDDQAFKVFKKVRWGDGKEVACPQCGVIHDRDINAARNIKAAGLAVLAIGGNNTDDNIQLLCAKCNHQKHAKTPG